jgi:hypothetical protein
MVPSFPAQLAATPDEETASAVGCVTVICCVVEQLFASVMVTVYVPAPRPDAVGAFPPDGAQA